MIDIDQTWDDIVVGGGSSGTVLASRLSEIESRSVLLIEAGKKFSETHFPEQLRNAKHPIMSGFNWDFLANLKTSSLFEKICGLTEESNAIGNIPRIQTSEIMESNTRHLTYPSGKVLGGSSAINGTLALRGLSSDFDQWAALGNPEWNWDKVLPYFIKLENDHDFSDGVHGKQGLLPITHATLDKLHALQRGFLQACKAHGIPECADMNGLHNCAVGPAPSNSIDQVRISIADAYLAPASSRSNLTIYTEQMVSRIVFNGAKAVGVEIVNQLGEKKIIAGKRITLSAGAIGTVSILTRSGIGNKYLCQQLGIDLKLDRPGVGENLMEHPAVVMWMIPKPGVCEEDKPWHQMMAKVSSSLGPVPDLNLFMLGNVSTKDIPMLNEVLRKPLAGGLSVVLTNPLSRGRVFLQNAALESSPVIELNLLSKTEDIKRLMSGIRLAWKLLCSKDLSELTESVFFWKDAVINNDDYLKMSINRFVSAAWHAAGTAKMGSINDNMAVVDQYCRVYGIDNLRVVDASVMPKIPNAATNLTCVMLAERVADWMKSEA